MTPRQKKLLTFIRDYVDQHGFAPTFNEMCESVGIASKSNAHAIVNRLVMLGYLVRRPGHHRAIWPAAPVREGVFDLAAIPTSVLRNELARRSPIPVPTIQDELARRGAGQ